MKKIVFVLFLLLVFYGCKKKKEVELVTNWIKTPNPVLAKGEPYGSDFYALSDCWVINDKGTYKMWYTGGGAVYPDTILHSSIHYATSTDGVNWQKHNQNPVLDVSSTAWDSLGVETASVLVDEDAIPSQRYKMWYAGQTKNEYEYDIGYAYSANGIQWVKHPDPVVVVGQTGEWDNYFLEGPSVIKENNSYKMWYAAFDYNADGQVSDYKVAIGYATSTDGINWVKYSGNPVLLPSNDEWDAVYVQDPHVVKYNGGYHMWYGGTDVYDNYFQQTGYAFSHDGISWEKSKNNPVVKRGVAGSWDGNTASFPSVLIEGDKMKMWYTGKDVEPLPDWPTPYYWDIGYCSKAKPSHYLLD